MQLRHPGMSDATESNGEAGPEESEILGHEDAWAGDESLNLEAQEYEAEEYDGEDFPADREGDEEEDELEDEGLVLDPHPPGLKEISNLGKFTVSTHKQDNGVDELRSDDLGKFWQYVAPPLSFKHQQASSPKTRSDGTQPHNLTVYFIKKVAIREIRFYVDYDQDESYTPTRIVFRSGTSENGMLRFASMELTSPKGWQKVPLEGVGGGADGNTLFCWVLQV
ncbi:hypothetical protein IMZ48_39015, partial [Candidatus Bathyarchaeota archaeon]|nr:hypothetical protein [Candidatus Bathyarchaeota archaeon]